MISVLFLLCGDWNVPLNWQSRRLCNRGKGNDSFRRGLNLAFTGTFQLQCVSKTDLARLNTALNVSSNSAGDKVWPQWQVIIGNDMHYKRPVKPDRQHRGTQKMLGLASRGHEDTELSNPPMTDGQTGPFWRIQCPSDRPVAEAWCNEQKYHQTHTHKLSHVYDRTERRRGSCVFTPKDMRPVKTQISSVCVSCGVFIRQRRRKNQRAVFTLCSSSLALFVCHSFCLMCRWPTSVGVNVKYNICHM